MDDMIQTSSPPRLDWDRIIHNHISYLIQSIVLVSDPGAGLRPPPPIPYGFGGGADTMHPVDYHGSTCLRNSNRQLGWLTKITISDWLCTTFPILWDDIIGY